MAAAAEAEGAAAEEAVVTDTFADDPLWQEIQSVRLDREDAALPFSARLARENGWPRAYALLVIEEYRRFLYLMCRAGHPVTPSVEVDQAWHLHLLYTESYWQDLAPRLPVAPHHGPTRGGGKEDEKFTDWYGKTLQSYQRLFGMAPPSHIWPPASLRFAPDQRFVFIDAGRHYVISKASLHRIGIPLGLLALLTIGWLLP